MYYIDLFDFLYILCFTVFLFSFNMLAVAIFPSLDSELIFTFVTIHLINNDQFVVPVYLFL